jgi:hypothetical protein
MVEGDLDRQIVKLVYDYRILSQEQLQRLMGKSKPQMQRLLRRLYDHQYLERVFLPVSTFGAPPTLYILDNRGVECLQVQGIGDFSTQPKKTISPFFMDHSRALNEFRIAVSQSCEQHGFRLLSWITENELKANYDRVEIPSQKEKVSLIPDSFFVIEVPGKQPSGFFVELDRGTMSNKKFRQKIEAYISYYKTGAYTRRFKLRGFRLLTVIDRAGERRQKNLLQTSARVNGIAKRHWFALMDQVIENDPLTEPVWMIAGDSKPYPIFS